MRGCDPSRCKKYVKGDRLPWKDDIEGDNPREWNHRVPYLQLGVKHGRKKIKDPLLRTESTENFVGSGALL